MANTLAGMGHCYAAWHVRVLKIKYWKLCSCIFNSINRTTVLFVYLEVLRIRGIYFTECAIEWSRAGRGEVQDKVSLNYRLQMSKH